MRWLGVVGIGEDGVAGLGAHARALIGAAETVFGGRRHLDLAAELIAGEAVAWSSPLSGSIEAILALRGRRVCVLASGDPFLFGIGATLGRHVGPEEMDVVPAPSAFSLAAARLGWPLQKVRTLSAHGRPLELVLPHLQPGARLLVLTSDGDGPPGLARLLVSNGFGRSRLTVLESLGGPNERIAPFSGAPAGPLNLCAIEVLADPGARVLPRAPGLEDALFEHDGQITKREIRAMVLSALAPLEGELLWDVGAGSGAVGIEWMLRDPSLRAIAVEVDPARALRIGRNSLAFGVPGLDVVVGSVPGALDGLERPDAIFVGGAVGVEGVIPAVVSALRPGGRLVVNAVTLEGEAVLIARHAAHGGELTRIALSRAAPLGALTAWRPALPVIQWRWTKP